MATGYIVKGQKQGIFSYWDGRGFGNDLNEATFFTAIESADYIASRLRIVSDFDQIETVSVATSIAFTPNTKSNGETAVLIEVAKASATDENSEKA